MSDLYVCSYKQARLGGSGGMLPQESFRNIRCSEIVSEAILGQKQSHVNSLRARFALVLHEQTRIAAAKLVWTAVILNRWTVYSTEKLSNCQ